jgi:5-methylcytosine-specific restriction endonuclease McrA
MKPKTLLVDNCYNPILVIDWRKAIHLVCLNKVEVIETHEESVTSPNLAIKIPSVLRLFFPVKKAKKQVKFSRNNVLARDQYTCQYCGLSGSKLTIDHVLPQSRGGKTNWLNTVTACASCQTKKGCQTPREAGMVLLNKPKQPIWARAAEIKAKIRNIYPEWGVYLFI